VILNRLLIMNGLDDLRYLNPIVLAVVALPTPLMAAKDVFTFHSSEGASA